jgi:hypothetical protein
MIRHYISRLLRLEPAEIVKEKIQTLNDAHQKEILFYKSKIENLDLEIDSLNEQLNTLISQTIDPATILEKDILIDELRNTITLFEDMLEDDNFANTEQRKKYYEAKEKKQYPPSTTPAPKSYKNQAIHPNNETPKPKRASLKESYSFIQNRNEPAKRIHNSVVSSIIEKLAKINLTVEYIDDQFVLVKKNGSRLPLRERFTHIEIYEDGALILTDTNGNHAAFCLNTGNRLSKSSQDKSIVISDIENINHYAELFDQLNTNKQNGKESPHKRILLLSIIDSIEKGQIASPEIELTPTLENAYNHLWEQHIDNESFYQRNIKVPFTYMFSEPFWHQATTPEDPNTVNKAFIDTPLFNLLQDEKSRTYLTTRLEQRLQLN